MGQHRCLWSSIHSKTVVFLAKLRPIVLAPTCFVVFSKTERAGLLLFIIQIKVTKKFFLTLYLM